ncbi:MAG TPA: hypothetical protein VN673_19080, partial [Clostridia bacterium]|nr:hypothetical protein [Clostridia bacterium]
GEAVGVNNSLNLLPSDVAGPNVYLGRSQFGNDPYFNGRIDALRLYGRAEAILENGDWNGDGLPDAWQVEFFGGMTEREGEPGNDFDGDGFNNMQEFLAGTNPTDAGDYLRIEWIETAGSGRALRFRAVAGRSYSILYKDRLEEASWQRLADVPAQGASGAVVVADPNPSVTGRLYRLVTPGVSNP